jgi:hypothetical protein
LLNSSNSYRYIFDTNYYFFFGRFAEFFITIIPIFFIYVIVKHQVFEINFIIRQGLQYLLAKNFLRGVLVLEVVGVIFIAVLNPNLTLGQVFSPKHFYFYLVLATIISFFYRTEITNTLDKKFFQEAYNRERVLAELLEEIKKLNTIKEISLLVSNRLLEVLCPKNFYIFYCDKEKQDAVLKLANDISDNSSTSNSKIFLEVPRLMELMKSRQSTRLIDFLRTIPSEEEQQLTDLQAELIIPINGISQQLFGLLLIGEKDSGEPYSQKDKNLLEDIAHQLGIVYENTLLKEEVNREEKIKQDVLAKLEEKNINLVKECPSCGRCFDSTVEFCEIDKRRLAITLPVEKVIEQKYSLEKLLGKGGMGAVYIAKDLHLGRGVAVKILRANMFGDQEAVKRFEREAKASAKVTHPNIISIYDYGKLASEGAYLVMELVEGSTLKSKINQQNPMPAIVVADLFDQILDGVKVAHKAGIIHRDLKPDNILITEVSGRMSAKILDFGLAKIKSINKLDGNSLTAPGTVMGTFGYMPPEQFSGETIDERADIFALGVILIELLTGNKPFVGKTAYEIMGAMLKNQYHLPSSNKKEIQDLDEKIQKCIAKTPKDRFSSIDEMQKEIIPAISKCPNIVSSSMYISASEAETKIKN